MFRLNDDCLMDMFDYLPLSDQLTLMITCHRFRNLILNTWVRRYSEKSVGEILFYESHFIGMSKSDYFKFMRLLAPYLKQFTASNMEWLYLEKRRCIILNTSFPELTKLRWEGEELTDFDISRVTQNCPKMESFDLFHTKIHTPLKIFTNLTELILRASQIHVQNLKAVLTTLQLKHLDVTYTQAFGAHSLAAAVNILKNYQGNQNHCGNSLEQLTCCVPFLRDLITNQTYDVFKNLKTLQLFHGSGQFGNDMKAFLQSRQMFVHTMRVECNNLSADLPLYADNIKCLKVLEIITFDEYTVNVLLFPPILEFYPDIISVHVEFTNIVNCEKFLEWLLRIIRSLRRERRTLKIVIHFIYDLVELKFHRNQITALMQREELKDQKVVTVEVVNDLFREPFDFSIYVSRKEEQNLTNLVENIKLK